MISKKVAMKLTPEQAWEAFTPYGVDRFVSEMECDGYTDITAMCQRYARELPWAYGCPIDKEVIDHIAKLLEQYMRDYIKAKGGRNEAMKVLIKLLTHKITEKQVLKGYAKKGM